MSLWKPCELLSAYSSLLSLSVFPFPWLGLALARTCLFEGEGGQGCLSGHVDWAESVWSAGQCICICISPGNKPSGASTVTFYEAAKPVPSRLILAEAVIPLSGEYFLIHCPQNAFRFPHCSPPGRTIQSHPMKWIPSFRSLPADQHLLQSVPPPPRSSPPAQEPNSPSLPRAADFIPAALLSG